MWIALAFFTGLFVIPSLLGWFVLYHLFSGNKLPADESNRINSIRIFWFALTRPHNLAEQMGWLKNDEWENVGHWHK